MAASIMSMEAVGLEQGLKQMGQPQVLDPQDLGQDIGLDIVCGKARRVSSDWSASTEAMSTEAGDSDPGGMSPSSGPEDDEDDDDDDDVNSQGIDQDEYYAFLREMGCSFDQDEQDLSDEEDEEFTDSEDEEESDNEIVPSAAPKGVIPADPMKGDLPSFQGLDAAGCTQGGPTLPISGGYATMQTNCMEDDRLSSPFCSMQFTTNTSIAPGPSMMLLKALAGASKAVAHC